MKPTPAYVRTGISCLVAALVAVPWTCGHRAGSAAAEDIPGVRNPYARAKTAPAQSVDSSLAVALTSKIAECYRQEQDKPLDAEQQALLSEYAADVARELSPALAPLGCPLDRPVSANCRSTLSGLDCEELAQPIVEAGWDRNLTPEAKAKVIAYAEVLAARDAACEGRAAEEAAIVQEVAASRLSALIESEIVMGKCELLPAALGACETEAASAACEELSRLKEEGQLTHLCRSLLRCTDTAAPR